MRLVLHSLLVVLFSATFCFADFNLKLPFDFIQNVLLSPDLTVGAEKENVADLSYGLGVQVPSLQVFEGLGMAAGYSAAVAPAYHDDYYARLDTWKLNVNLTPGNVILDALNLPIRFGVTRGQEIVFVRFFPNRKEAALATPRHLMHLPLSAKRALEHMEPGDLVSIPARLSMVGHLVASNRFSLLKASVGTHLLVSGEFQLHFLRMRDGRVRLRIVSGQRREWGIVDAKIKAGVNLFALKFAGKKIKAATKISLAKFEELRQVGHLSFFDYIFDLRDEKAAEAFESIIGSVWRLKPAPILAEIQEGEHRQDFVSDLTKAEYLFAQDKDKPEEARRVDRVFKGLDDYTQRSRTLKLGLGFISFKGQATYTEHDLLYHDRDDVPSQFYYASSTATRKHKILFGLRYAKWTRSVSALYKKTESGALGEFECLCFSYMRKDKRYSSEEQRDFRWFTCSNLPREMYEKMDWQQWDFQTPQFDGKYHYQAFFHRKTFDIIQSYGKEELNSKLAEFMNDLVIPSSWRSKNEHRLEAMVDTLYRLAQPASNEVRKENIRQAVELRKNRAFRDIGAGYLMWLIPREKWQEAFHVQIKIKGRDLKKVKFKFGSLQDETFYHDLFYLQELLDNASFELRAEAVIEKADWNEEKKPSRQIEEKRRNRFESLYKD